MGLTDAGAICALTNVLTNADACTEINKRAGHTDAIAAATASDALGVYGCDVHGCWQRRWKY
jgi:hypothetical protein